MRAQASATGVGRAITHRVDVAVTLLVDLLTDNAVVGERPVLELFRDEEDVYIRCRVERGRSAPSLDHLEAIVECLRPSSDSLEVSRSADGALVGIIQRSLTLPPVCR